MIGTFWRTGDYKEYFCVQTELVNQHYLLTGTGPGETDPARGSQPFSCSCITLWSAKSCEISELWPTCRPSFGTDQNRFLLAGQIGKTKCALALLIS